MKQVLSVLVVVSAAACSRTSEPRVDATPAGLWTLAPAAASGGAVAGGDAVVATLTTLRLARAGAAAASPQLAAQIDLAAAMQLPLAIHDPDAIAKAGIDARRGAAVFWTSAGDRVTVLGLADEKAFRAAVGERLGATCRAIRGYMACSSSAELAGGVGAAREAPLARAAAALPAPLKGDIQVITDAGDPRSVRVGLRVARGTIEGRLQLPPVPLLPKQDARAPLADAIADAGATGAALADLSPVLPMLAGMSDAAGLAARAFRGDVLAVSVGSGGWLRAPLRDEALARTLLGRCAELARPGTLTATLRDGGCDLSFAFGPQITIPARVHITEGELRADVGTGGPGRGAPPAALAALFAEPWNIAAWGRFSLASAAVADAPVDDPSLLAAAAMIAHIDELGVAVRGTGDSTEVWFRIGTVWRNPDDVLAALEPVLARVGRDTTVSTDLRALAAKFPDSPLAEDVRVGFHAGLPVAFATGVLAGTAIPAFMKYVAASRGGQAELARATAKRYALEAYPQWAVSNPSSPCPARIDDLLEYVRDKQAVDPWNQPYEMRCGDQLPAGAKGIGVFSRGPDGQAGTADDINSWD